MMDVKVNFSDNVKKAFQSMYNKRTVKESPEEIEKYRRLAEEKAKRLAEEKAKKEAEENYKTSEIEFYKRLAEEKYKLLVAEKAKREELDRIINNELDERKKAIDIACHSAISNILFYSNFGTAGECREKSREIDLSNWESLTKNFLTYFWRTLEICEKNEEDDLDMTISNIAEVELVSGFIKSIGDYDNEKKTPFILNHLKKRFTIDEIISSLRVIYTEIGEAIGVEIKIFDDPLCPIIECEIDVTQEQEEEILKNCNDSNELIMILNGFFTESDRFSVSSNEKKCFTCYIDDGNQFIIANLGKDFTIMASGMIDGMPYYFPVSLTKNESIARRLISERRLWLTEAESAEVMKTSVDPRVLPYIDTSDRVITLSIKELKFFNEKLLNLLNVLTCRYTTVPRFRISSFKSIDRFDLVYDSHVELVCPGTFTSAHHLPSIACVKVRGNDVIFKDGFGTRTLSLKK